MKLWLEKNDIEVYSAHNQVKSIVAERFIRTLKNRIYKYMINKYNNTYHSAIKMKPCNVKSSKYIDPHQKNREEGPKFRVGDHTRIWKYKNIFAKDYFPN